MAPSGSEWHIVAKSSFRLDKRRPKKCQSSQRGARVSKKGLKRHHSGIKEARSGLKSPREAQKLPE